MTRIWQPNNNPVIPGMPTGDKKPFWFFSTARRWTDSQDGMVGNRDMVTTMLLNYGSASAGPQKAPGKKPGDKNLCSLTNWGYKYVKHLAFLTSLEKKPKEIHTPNLKLEPSADVTKLEFRGFKANNAQIYSFDAWLLKFLVCWRTWTMGFWWCQLNHVEPVGLGDAADFFLCLANHVDTWWIDLAWEVFFFKGISTYPLVI